MREQLGRVVAVVARCCWTHTAVGHVVESISNEYGWTMRRCHVNCRLVTLRAYLIDGIK